MAEHLYAYGLSGRPADVLFADGTVDGRHLTEVQFPGQHCHIGIALLMLSCVDRCTSIPI